MKRFALCLVVLGTLAPALARAQTDPPDAARLFSHQARVTQLGASSYRLPLGAEVLSICRADLSDVRLYDATGAEIAWMLDSATRVVPREVQQVGDTSAPIMQVLTHETEGPTRAPTGFREVYEISGPGEPPSRAGWDLVMGTLRAPFVASVRVNGRSQGTGEGALIGSSSTYRFVGPTRELLRVPVDVSTTDRVRVTIEGHDGFLDPTFYWAASRRARAGEALVVPLEIVSRTREGTQTVLTLTRPEGIVPEMLRFATTSPAFLRAVHVESAGRTTDDTLWRVPGPLGAEVLEVDAPSARGPVLTVRIDDQDSPPLEDLSVSAVLRRPVLVYFTQAEMLRFGGGRVRAAHYDLDALQGSWVIDQLLDGSQTPLDATLGPITASPGWTNEPALAFLQRAGVEVPAGEHAFSAPLAVSAATEGASRFVLDASVLSAARQDVADLRIVDAEGRQWPYLWRDTDPLDVPVTLGAPSREGEETRYDVTLPVPIVLASEIHVDPVAPLVSRPVRIVGTDVRGDEQALTSTSLMRYLDGDAGPIVVPLGAMRVSTMTLFVSDGSETPLAFRASSLAIPTREIVLVAPPGSYRLLVGQPDAQAPTYEIERVRDLLGTIPLDDATLGPLAPNPAHHEPTFWERTDSSTLVLWSVLVLAILVLGVLTWRASQAPEPAGGGKSKSESESEGESTGEGESEGERKPE